MSTTPTSAGTASTATLPTPDQSFPYRFDQDPYDERRGKDESEPIELGEQGTRINHIIRGGSDNHLHPLNTSSFNKQQQNHHYHHHHHQLFAMSNSNAQRYADSDIFHFHSHSDSHSHSHTHSQSSPPKTFSLENGSPSLRTRPDFDKSSSSTHGSSHSYSHSQSKHRRSNPPPPILLKQTSSPDSHSSTHLDPTTRTKIPPTPTSSLVNGFGPSQSISDVGSGLNIAGLSFPSEEEDSLSDLLPSPNRRVFAAGLNDPTGAPKTPLWTGTTDHSTPVPINQNGRVEEILNTSSSTSSSTFSPLSSPNANHPPTPSSGLTPFANFSISNNTLGQGNRRSSLEVPSPSLTSPFHQSHTRFEPTPHHGLHARNLSLFFPQPGAATVAPASPGAPAMETFISRPPQTPDNRGKRRGHHHKHSLSHNFFSFLDPTQTNPVLNNAPNLTSFSANPSQLTTTAILHDTPTPVPMPLTSARTTLAAMPTSTKSSLSRMLASGATLQFVLGAGLWVEGQVGGWRCLAAVGYLVVFDAIGIAVSMISKTEGGRTLRRPYGISRLVAVLCFAQSVFLAFAAVYITKEAVEQVLLGAGHEHGHSHDPNQGGYVHDGDKRSFPHFLLLCAGASSLAAGLLGNHAALVEATGSLFLPNWFTSIAPDLSNPYTLSVCGSCLFILLGSLSTSSMSTLHTIDSSLSLFLTILTIALAVPATKTFAHVLLQTAPAPTSQQMKSLKRALRDVQDDKRVLGIGTMRCWQVVPGKFSIESTSSTTQTGLWGGNTGFDTNDGNLAPISRRGSSSMSSPSLRSTMTLSPMSSYFDLSSHGGIKLPTKMGHAPLVVTFCVHVHPDSSDRDVLEITKLAWTKVHAAVSGRREGEVTVQVKRGWEQS